MPIWPKKIQRPKSFGNWLLILLALIFGTYNPSGVSFVHWLVADISHALPLKFFLGITLMILWVLLIRLAFNILGKLGLVLALVFMLALVIMLVNWGLMPLGNLQIWVYLLETMFAAILAAALSWPTLRQRLQGSSRESID